MPTTKVRGAEVELDGPEAVSVARVQSNGRNGNHTDNEQIGLFKVSMAHDVSDFVNPVINCPYIGEGPQVKAFEREFSGLVGTTDPPVLAVNSCTSAITLALKLCGVGPGDYVISTPMTCSATNTPIANLGAKILWADIDPQTGLIDFQSIHDLLYEDGWRNKSVKAIIAVDWAGSPCDYLALKFLGIPVIQDAAHRIFVGENHGDYVCWSFGPIKHLTCGDGGGLLVPKEQYERAKLLRWYGLDRESKSDFRCSQSIAEAGYKFHMNDISASIGRANLRYLRMNVETHKWNAAKIWDAANKRNNYADALYHPNFHVSDYWFYPMLVDDREGFTKYMAERGIMVSQVHRRNDEHECFAAYRRPLPGVDAFSARNVGIPCHAALSASDIDRITTAISEWSR